MQKLSLQTLHGGAMLDMFSEELQKILVNIQDLNTKATSTRSITVKFDIKPNSERSDAQTNLSVTSKLAPIKPTEGVVFFDMSDGTVEAFQHNPKQAALDFGQAQKIGG